MRKYTYKKYMGDDTYSWAVFRDGRPYATGMDRGEAKRLKERLEREDKAVDDDAKKELRAQKLAQAVNVYKFETGRKWRA